MRDCCVFSGLHSSSFQRKLKCWNFHPIFIICSTPTRSHSGWVGRRKIKNFKFFSLSLSSQSSSAHCNFSHSPSRFKTMQSQIGKLYSHSINFSLSLASDRCCCCCHSSCCSSSLRSTQAEIVYIVNISFQILSFLLRKQKMDFYPTLRTHTTRLVGYMLIWFRGGISSEKRRRVLSTRESSSNHILEPTQAMRLRLIIFPVAVN